MTVNQGTIISIRGSVVDVLFPNLLPEPRSLLKAGEDRRVALEVMTYLGSELVRTIALNPTQGLSRGSMVIDTGYPLQVPVGDALLGRMFNVFGDTIDGRKPLSNEKLRPLHAHPIPLCDRATTTDIFLTGIKAID
ncbi:MAG: F0F1 ATP synthase subunit beta, partial [Cyanobacteria bacterium J06621_12]